MILALRLAIVFTYLLLVFACIIVGEDVDPIMATGILLLGASAGAFGYFLGWWVREQMETDPPDQLRAGMRVTPPLELRHIDALLAFGENCFGPMELDDDHDDALAILREHRPITQREDPR